MRCGRGALTIPDVYAHTRTDVDTQRTQYRNAIRYYESSLPDDFKNKDGEADEYVAGYVVPARKAATAASRVPAPTEIRVVFPTSPRYALPIGAPRAAPPPSAPPIHTSASIAPRTPARGYLSLISPHRPAQLGDQAMWASDDITLRVLRVSNVPRARPPRTCASHHEALPTSGQHAVDVRRPSRAGVLARSRSCIACVVRTVPPMHNRAQLARSLFPAPHQSINAPILPFSHTSPASLGRLGRQRCAAITARKHARLK